METVRKMNEMGRGASLGDPQVEDYLRAVSSDPTTEWFTELLREKNEELTKERERADQLACALRAWFGTRQAAGELPADEAELHLVNLLRTMEILNG
jgi:hypothetical protein